MAGTQDVVDVDGHRLKLTNLDKVLYPETGTTKADVIGYYAAVADYLIPRAAHRPATRKRWVNGVGTAQEPGEMFFEKNLPDSAPSWVKRGTIEHSKHTNEYPLVNNLATLIWLAQIAALEIHVPQWQFGRNGAQKNPDRLVLDLDPGEGAGLAECVEVAKLARGILKDMGLDPMPVTSGSKGIHLYAALDGKQTSQQVSEVAHELARALEADHPELIVSDMKKSLRRGKVLVDWSQNNAAKTTIVPYSLRGRPHPMVAVPRTWRELSSSDLEQLDYQQVIARMTRRKDPLDALNAGHPDAGHLGSVRDADAAGADRLETYRKKRDSSKTPEPVPSGFTQAAPGRSFVIQRHDASRLHYDFRLEHDGVLVSWALPKGVPTDPKKNHLAVQTEDHPLDYGTFEGTIPKGEYGGGEVVIWDSGEYDLEKWRDGKEVIAILHGEQGGGLGGPCKYALIHTGGEGRAESNWLIHRMELDQAVPEASKKKKAPSKKASATSATKASNDVERAKPIAPMLATAGTEKDLDDDDEWAFEMKWDGIRAIAYLPGDGSPIRLLSRNGIEQASTYPDVVEALESEVGGSAIIDGEIVAFNRKGRPDFGVLQQRMNLSKPADVKRMITSTPVHYLIFDILGSEGTPLFSETYDRRREILEALIEDGGLVGVPPAFDGNFDAVFASSKELGLEGVVAKKRDSIYRPGRRSPSWVKIKHHTTQEVIVGGWKPGNGRRTGLVGSLLIGVPDAGGIRYVGRVGSGFSERGLAELTKKLTAIERKTSGLQDVPRPDARDVHWVSPKFVGEVEFTEWTSADRLRHPVWRGWRPDKSPNDVVRE